MKGFDHIAAVCCATHSVTSLRMFGCYLIIFALWMMESQALTDVPA